MTTTATMTEHIDTREGWREVPYGTRPSEPGWVMECKPDGTERYWVREAPVPPLPTEPYTVIRAKVRRIHDVAEQTLVHMGGSDDPWIGLYGGIRLGPVPADGIIGFEVLAEPVDARFSERAIRKATAKAVLDRVHERFMAEGPNPVYLDDIAREFGVNHD